MSKYETTLRHIEDLTANEKMIALLLAQCEADPAKNHYIPAYEAKLAKIREDITKLQTAL